MTTRLPNLGALQAFEAAARHASFARAAAELGVTAAAVSHRVRDLERQLGRMLFERLNRAVRLTPEGRALAAALGDGFARIRAGVDECRGRSQALALNVVPSLAAKWLVPRLDRFTAREPAVAVTVTATEALSAPGSRDAAVAIRFGAGPYPGLDAQILFPLILTPVCTPALAGRLKRPEDLTAMVLLHDTPRQVVMPGWPEWLALAGLAGRVDGQRGPRFSAGSLTIEGALAGQGVALGIGPFVIDDIVAGRLVAPFPIVLRDHSLAYRLLCRPGGSDPAVARFASWIRDEAAVTNAVIAERLDHGRDGDAAPKPRQTRRSSARLSGTKPSNGFVRKAADQ
jgi:LysR family glycine cleavage system transcriptional activator